MFFRLTLVAGLILSSGSSAALADASNDLCPLYSKAEKNFGPYIQRKDVPFSLANRLESIKARVHALCFEPASNMIPVFSDDERKLFRSVAEDKIPQGSDLSKISLLKSESRHGALDARASGDPRSTANSNKPANGLNLVPSPDENKPAAPAAAAATQ